MGRWRGYVDTLLRRAALSTIAGMLAAVVAATVLVLHERPQLVEEGLLSPRLIGLLLATAISTGVQLALALWLCLLARDGARWAARMFRWLLYLLARLLVLVVVLVGGTVARTAAALSAAARAAVRSAVARRTARRAGELLHAVGQVLLEGAVAVVGVVAFAAALVVGAMAIGGGARIVVAVIDEPPAAADLVMRFGTAAALIYIGLGALAGCSLVAYRVALGPLTRWTSARW
ncbi:MAG: hypothetical protein ABI466_00775, partial [Chloroflexota bacterium]